MQNEDHKDQKQKLLQLMLEAIKRDEELRETFQVGDKFRFIRDRLNALKVNLDEHLSELQKKMEEKKDVLAEHEMLVYVHLYNAQGVLVQTWQKMLLPAAMYEHSVNRPIYTDKTHIEAFIRSKANKVQHGFLTIAMPKDAVMKSGGADSQKDTLGHPLIKIKEGSLVFNRVVSFTHNNHDYKVGENGALVKVG